MDRTQANMLSSVVSSFDFCAKDRSKGKLSTQIKCALPECAALFASRSGSQRFCSPRCRRVVSGRRYRKANPVSCNLAVQSWRKRNPEKQARLEKSSDLKKRYGITIEQKEARLKAQDYRCAGCGSLYIGGRGWCTDHDHKTGALRDELCSNCNSALGMVKESPEILLGLLAYVRKWS